jgi:hypothetical protein
VTVKYKRISKLIDRSWFPSAFLLVLVCGAAGGAASGLSPAMMIAGAALALIFWEFMEQIVSRRREGDLSLYNDPKWARGKLLVVSVGIGLLLAEGGLQVHISLPFGVVILAVLLILFGFSRFYRVIVHE